jgi:hypothetical protein
LYSLFPWKGAEHLSRVTVAAMAIENREPMRIKAQPAACNRIQPKSTQVPRPPDFALS